MDFIAAWRATVEAFTKVFDWKTGGRTKDENSLRNEAEKAQRAYDEALAAGDIERANRAYLELRRLRDKARSQRTGA